MKIYGTLLIILGYFFSSLALAQICDEPFSRPSYKSRGQYCQLGERVLDAYAINSFILCEEMEVDHLISLRQAWESGVCGKELVRLANDPRNLKFTHWRTNRTKGQKTPELFTQTLPTNIGRVVLKDADDLMLEYKIKTRGDIVEFKINQAAVGSARFVRVPVISVTSARLRELTYRTVGQRTLVFLSGRAVGYVLNTGLAIETLMISVCAFNKLTSPPQTDLMKARAEQLTTIFDHD